MLQEKKAKSFFLLKINNLKSSKKSACILDVSYAIISSVRVKLNNFRIYAIRLRTIEGGAVDVKKV